MFTDFKVLSKLDIKDFFKNSLARNHAQYCMVLKGYDNIIVSG